MVIIFYLFLSCSSKNSPSVLLARVPFVRSHCGRLFSPSSRSFHFSTLPFLRCVPFSPQIAHWPALLFTLPVRHSLSPQQPATTPPQPQPHSSLHPKRTIISLFHHHLHTVPQCAAAILSSGRHFKISERLLDSIRGV